MSNGKRTLVSFLDIRRRVLINLLYECGELNIDVVTCEHHLDVLGTIFHVYV